MRGRPRAIPRNNPFFNFKAVPEFGAGLITIFLNFVNQCHCPFFAFKVRLKISSFIKKVKNCAP